MTSTNIKKNDIKVLYKTKAMIKQLKIYLNHFPKHEKFALTLLIDKSALELYIALIEAVKRKKSSAALYKADNSHEILRMLLNLAFELGYFNYSHGKSKESEAEALRRYEAISSNINEIGKMIGGWIKFSQEAKV